MERTPRQRRHTKTRQDILDAARNVINQNGVEELTMRKLAEVIDYSPAGLYEYFDGKEGIIQALCLEGHQKLSEVIRRVDESLPPAEYLLEIGVAYIDFALKNPDHYLLMFTNVPTKAQLEDMFTEGSSFPLLVQAIQRGIEAGVFKTRLGFELYEMVYAAWSLVHGLAMLRITYLGEFELDFSTADREALLAFNRGLRAS